MFSYGKDNVIDFTNMSGTYGIFAANASGKSTLLDAFSYCIFDKCSKTNKSSQVLNSSSNTFYCKLEFELNGKSYFIERDGLREKNGNVRVKVNFYYIDDLGCKVSLNGKERSDTNASIRSVLGSYDDFILTALSAQGANSGFIDMNQKDRKELLSQFLDINVFENMYEIANNEMRDTSTIIKQLNKVDHSLEISKIDEEKKNIVEKIERLKLEKDKLETEKDEINKKILDDHKTIQIISSKTLNEDSLREDIVDLEKHLSSLVSKEALIVMQVKKVKEEITSHNIKLESIDVIKLENSIKQLKNLNQDKFTIDMELSGINIHISHQKDKLEKLEK
jgi:exonuclease SbcC